MAHQYWIMACIDLQRLYQWINIGPSIIASYSEWYDGRAVVVPVLMTDYGRKYQFLVTVVNIMAFLVPILRGENIHSVYISFLYTSMQKNWLTIHNKWNSSKHLGTTHLSIAGQERHTLHPCHRLTWTELFYYLACRAMTPSLSSLNLRIQSKYSAHSISYFPVIWMTTAMSGKV